MEIEIPLSEFESDHPNIGDFGEITLRVEVMEISQDEICVMKHGPIKITKPFKEINLEDMKKQIGTVEDTELPIQKNSKDKESE